MNIHPIIIAGPCSAESREQVLEAARGLSRVVLPRETGLGKISFFRAGIWKPRTEPGSFEGVGTRGLPWLMEVQDTYGLTACTEVAGTVHAEEVLRAGLRAVWIGARTTTNPFLVQEIARVLSGTGTQVFVKNPMHPDPGLWVGAVERFLREGLTSVCAVHRGFSENHAGSLRNAPLWMVPINFKLRLPQIPLLCDPSHLCGRTEFIAGIAQRALDLNFDGLMLEVHPHPCDALSDAPQQLDITSFEALMQTLQWRHSTPSGTEEAADKALLEALRLRIDILDEDIVDLLAQRMALVDRIGLLKKKAGVGIVQTERWTKGVLHRVEKLAEDKKLDIKFLNEVYEAIHKQSIARQESIMHQE